MAVHVMHDIETLSTANNPVLWSIGAVKFDGEQIIDRFEVGVDPASCQKIGLHLDAGTVLWWMDPKRDDARKHLLSLPAVDIHSALGGYHQWLLQTDKADRGSMWANGATFDHVKLRSAFDAAGFEVPWHYREEECYRTLQRRSPDVEFKRLGLHHGALDDSESQAVHLQAICKARGIEL